MPTTSLLSCDNTVTFNLTSSGYTGSQPTTGATGCNPCCYPGSDLDCDGSQDVPFSVENSVWYRYCNTSGSTQAIDINVDEPGSGGTCNLQGAIWTGAALNATTIACNNAGYNFFDSNAGGSSDGFSFSNVSVPNGQCVYIMIDGYNGNTCSNIGITINCPCVPPTLTTSPNTSVCPGQSTTLTVSGAVSYTWSPSTGLSSITGSSVVASPFTSTIYTVIGTAADGCTSSKTITVGVKAKPTITLTPNTASCGMPNGSIAATPAGATVPYTYLWSNGSTLQSPTNLSPGAYTVTISSSNGCTNSATAIVGNTTMSVNVSTSPSTCSTSEGEASVSVSGTSGPYTYLWTTGATTSTINSLSNGTFYVTVTAAGGCTAIGTADIDGSQGPEFNIAYTPSTCNQPNGSVNVTPTNGGGNPFTYQWSNGATTEDIGGAAPGTYTVTVTRANGCTSLGMVIIGSTPPVILNSPTVLNATCGTANGSATANVQSGSGPFTYIWSNGATTATAANLAAGSYTYTVTAANGCTSAATANVSNSAAPVISTTSTNSTCGNSNGSMSVSVVSGGISPFTYQWSNGVTSTVVTNIPAASYTVTVTDAVGCQTTQSVNVSNLPSPVITMTPSFSTCGNANGDVTLNLLSGNNAPLTYQWSNGTTASVLNNVLAATYSVTVTNGTGCTASQSTTVTDLPAPSFDLVETNSTCGLNNGYVSVENIVAGTAPFSYDWSTNATTQNLANVGAGSYSLTITDANGCTSSQSATVTTTTVPSVTVNTTFATCGNPNGTATASVVNGTAPFIYTWTNGSTGVTISNLSVGTYGVTVTDAVGCTGSASGTIANRPPPTLSQSHVNATCGYSNGAINLSVTNVAGASPFTYSWSNGSTTQDISSVPGGTYSVTVTNAFGCTSALIIDLPNTPAPQLQLVPNTSTCGNANGAVNAQVIGGTSPFTYQWNTGVNTQDLVNKTAGTYTLTVTDANGCTAIQSATVNNTPGPTLTTTIINTTCGIANGSASVNTFGGTSPFTYQWSNAGTTSTINSLATGNYSVTVTDANGCTASVTTSIANSTSPIISLTPVSSTCGNSNGGITSIISQGIPGYTFSWSNGATTQNLSNVIAGAYSLTVTDAGGCTVSAVSTISNITGPTLALSSTNASCGLNNGTATANPSAGATPYAYSWNTTSTNPFISGLAAGSYSVTVTDANSCSISQSISISSASAPSVTLSPINSTCNLANGSISTVATNGTSPYTYAWNTGATTSVLSGLAAGNYSVTIFDAVGCSVTQSTTLSTSQLPSITLNSTNPTCELSNGSIASTTTTGNAPYTFLWSSGSTSSSINSLGAGSYIVTVTTSDGCTATQSVLLNTTTVPTLSISATPTTCGLTNGSLSATAANATSPFSYAWSNGQTGSIVNNLSSGNYSVTVTSANGCTAFSSANVATSVPPALQLTPQSSTCGSSNGSIATTVNQGTSPYTFIWNTGATTLNLSNVTSGGYTVTMMDAVGCTVSQTASVSNIAGPIISISSTATTCGFSNGAAAVVTNNGTAPYTFTWNGGATNASITGLPTGLYAVTVTDANGCTIATSTNVAASTSPSVTVTTVNSTCGYSNGNVVASVTLGTAPYTFVWSNGSTTQNNSNVLSGFYNITVTDAGGCTASATAIVSNTTGPVLSLSVSNATCGLSNGSISSTPNGGTTPYTYAWSTGSTGSSITNLSAGTFTLTLTDANGCTAVQSQSVSAASAPTVSINVTHATCGLSNGSANALVVNGTSPYSFTWSNGATTSSVTGINTGSYTVTVTDNVGCTELQSVSVSNFTSPSIFVNAVDATCNLANGSINSTVSGGTSPFAFIWSNGATTQNVSGLSSGSSSVTVTDANGCTATTNIAVNNFPPPTIALTTTSSTCGLPNGIVTAVATGTGTLIYNWSNGATTTNLNSVSAGTYSLTVTDVNGCTTASAISLSNIPGPTLAATSTNAACGMSNGSASVTINGGTSPYTTLWSNGSTNQSITAIAAGAYSATVTDANGCTITAIANVSNLSGPTASIASTTSSTCGNANGSVTLSVTGGSLPLQFVWSNGSTLQNLSSVIAGSYSVTVLDANNCQATATALVTDIPGATVTLTGVNATCGLTNGSIALSLTNGTAPFVFAWSNGATSQNINSLDAGVYSVTVSDANACTSTQTISLTAATAPVLTLNPADETCSASNGIIVANGASGTSPYTYLWSNGSSFQSAVNLAAGNYSVTLTDAAGCTVTANAAIANQAAPTFIITHANSTCIAANGSAQVSNLSGGISPFTYSWSNGATTSSITNVLAGNYSLTVTDGNGCTFTQTANITDAPPPSITTTVINATCSLANGSVETSVNAGTAPFTYSWSSGFTGQNISAIPQGLYTVTVTDSNGCTATTTASVSDSPLPLIALMATPSTCENANGSIIANVSNGTPGFVFEWSNGATTQQAINLLSGTYSITITDDVGCTATATVVVTNIASPSLTAAVFSETCSSSNGVVTLTLTNGTAPFEYIWNNGATSDLLNNVSAGNYSVTVTDANACSATANAIVNNEGAPSVVSITPSGTTCSNANGLVDLEVTGGTGSLSYNWSNGATSQDLSGVSFGAYGVTVTDDNGCIVSAAIVVPDSPAPSLTTVPTNSTCELPNGSVDLFVTGGSAPFSFAWNNAATTEDISSLSIGAYDVIVTDVNGCTAATNISISTTSVPVLSVAPTNAICALPNGAISTNISSGTPPYTSAWSTGAISTSLVNIDAGSFSVTITDAIGCTATQTADITNTLPPLTVLVASPSSCGQSDGDVSMTVTDGTQPFTYAWSNGSTETSLLNIPTGSYTVTVTDALGCTTVQTTNVTDNSGPVISTAVVNTSCGLINGSVDVSVSGGALPYLFVWSNGATTEDINDIDDGNYSITVTDTNGCQAIGLVTMNGSTSPAISFVSNTSTCNQSNGNVVANIDDGIPAYTYSWSNGTSDQNLNNVTAGVYTLTVTDAVGCTASQSVNVANTPVVDFQLIASNPNCEGSDGSIQSVIIDGTAPFTYTWSNGETTQTATNLQVGTYAVTIIDAVGCSATQATTLNTTTPPTIISIDATNANCSQPNGALAPTINGGVPPYTFAWSNGTTQQNLTNIGVGNYTLTVTDAAGCTTYQDAVVSNISGPAITTNIFSSTCGNANGLVEVSVSGGVLPYTFEWSTGLTDEDLTNVNAGSYTLTVTDAANCQAVENVSIANIAGPSISVDVVNSTCELPNGQAIVSIVDGTAPYTILWSTNDTSVSTTGLAEGSYSVSVLDANGCTIDQNFSVATTLTPSVAIETTNATCGNDNGTATTTIVDGTTPFIYSWSNSATTSNINNLSTGTYDVTITDFVGCTASAYAILLASSLPAASEIHVDAICGYANGSIDLSVIDGALPYSYNWSNGATGDDVMNLLAGTYAVTIADNNGCTATISVTLADTDPPMLSGSTSSASCGQNDGGINLVVNGAAPYQYLWNNGTTTEDLSNIIAGNYTVTVTDINSCTGEISFTVNNDAAPTVVASVINNATCSNANANAGLDITGGAAPYVIVWSNGSTDLQLINVNAGIYLVTVIDANGCVATTSVELLTATSPVISALVVDETCNALNGSIDISITGGAQPFTFAWSNSFSNEDLTSLAAGNYSLTVSDVNGCSDTLDMTVNGTAILEVTLSSAHTTCNIDNGLINANVTGGTPPYNFLWSNGSTDQNIGNLAAGNYSLTIIDAAACSVIASTVVNASTNPILNFTTTSANCGNANGSIDVTVLSGTAPFIYNWSNGSSSEDLTAAIAGSYGVTVTDAIGCTVNGTAVVDNIGAPTITFIVTNATCQTDDGNIVSNVTDGASPFQYLWSNGSTNSNLDSLSSGTYSLTVTDSANCVAVQTAIVTTPALPTVSLVEQNATCGFPNGLVDVTVSQGTDPYNYIWSNGATTQDLSDLAAANYILTVVDSAGCTITEDASISNVPGPVVDVVIVNTSCGNDNGLVDVTISDGASPYTIAWSNGSSDEDLYNVAPGSYELTVTDQYGCVAVATAFVDSSESLAVILTSQNAACNQNNGSISLNILNANAPFTFVWSNGVTTQNLVNVAAGVYSVTVSDANSCTAVQNENVSNAGAPSLSYVQTPSLCGNANGGVDITVSGGTIPYSFTWSNGQTVEDLINVSAAIYSITVTDANNCQTVATINVTNIPGPTLQSTFTAVTCGNANGGINLTVTGGTIPYTYVWSNSATIQDINNLTIGSYVVTVADGNGCTASHTRNVTGTPAPVLSLSTANATCGLNGAVAANASGGIPPFQYSWSTGSVTSSITNLAIGTYTVTITSAAGCTATASANVIGTTAPVVAITGTNASCGNANGSVTLAITNAPAPFTYQWNNGAITQNINNLNAGSYAVTVTSSNGCSASAQTSISGSASLGLNVITTNATCNSTNGTATANISGATSTLAYNWSNGATTQSIVNLASDIYSVTVSDAGGCSAVDTIAIIGEPCAIIINLQPTNGECGFQNGLVEATVTGGTSPYTYLWSNGVTTSSINNLTPGSYSITVTDALGATSTATATITGTEAVATSLSITNASCGQSNGSIVTTVAGGTSPYVFSWSNGVTTQNLTNIAVGIYTITVTSADGCTAVDTGVITNLNGPQISLNATAAVCTQANGLVEADVNNGAAPYSFMWSNGSTTQDLVNVIAGSYALTVTDANGCQDVTTITVNASVSISLTTSSTNSTCGNANGSIDLSLSNGAAPYTFNWNNGVTIEDLLNISAGTYNVTAIDANGCSSTLSATVANVSGPALSSLVVNETCGEANGSIDISVSSGTQPFTYAWSTGATIQDLNNITAGTYNVTITDSNGCSAQQLFNISNASSPTVTASSVNSNCGMDNGSVSIAISNGASPYNFEWSNGATTQNISNIAVNSYNVIVTDANGCTATANANVVAINAPSLSFVSSPSGCTVANGSVDVSVTGGVQPYMYSWSNGASTQDLANQLAGIYTVTVTDATNCTTVLNTTITSTNPPSLSVFAIDATCGNINGSITTEVVGLAPLAYQWNNGVTSQDAINLSQGTYAVTVFDANGCSVSENANIANSSVPVITVDTVYSEACDQASGAVNVSVTGGASPYSFFWNNGATTEDLNGAISGNYNIVVVDNNGCTASQDAFVGFINAPQGFVNTMPEMCGGNNGLVDLTVVGGTLPYNFIWSNGASTEDLSQLIGGAYDVIVVDSNNCIFQLTADVVIVPYFNVQLSTIPDTVCFDSEVSITASGCATYNWIPSIGLNASTGTINIATVTAATTYTVIGTDVNGCTSLATFDVQPAPVTMAATDGGPYSGCPPYDCILLSNNTNSNGTQWWVDGELVSTSDGALLTLGTGIYDVELIAFSPYGCHDTLSLPTYIEVFDVPVAAFEMEQTNDVDGEFEFTNLSTGGNAFAWNFGDGSVDSTYSPLHEYAIPANYTVTLITTNSDGCSDTTARTMPADWPLNVFIPNTFTPNGDGVNDYFTLFGDGFKRFHLRVYDRWGEKVFDTDEGILTWDGNFKNKPLNTAVFVYIADIELLDGFSMRRYGDVTLLR